jgi:LysM repeat protein
MNADSHIYRFISRILLTGMFCFGCFVASTAQKKNKYYEEYITKYKEIAWKNQTNHKIPSSITLAQGLLESGAGKSDLATRANNHFGIKCHNDWKGKTFKANDDRKNECFRKYKKVEDSFEDHSLFLTQKSRYSRLFTLPLDDYRGWAKGLQTSGYATDKAYANKLIKLIEDYELYQYDTQKQSNKKKSKKTGKESTTNRKNHTPYISYGLLFVVAKQGDTFDDIAGEFGFRSGKLDKYNEAPVDLPLRKGDIVYFEKKNAAASGSNSTHTIKVGESMHSISQRYGMRVNNLYKLNKLGQEYVPVEGHILKLK